MEADIMSLTLCKCILDKLRTILFFNGTHLFHDLFNQLFATHFRRNKV